jgi:AcrR family transcriptional regulator
MFACIVAGVTGRVKGSGAVGDADWWLGQHALAASRRPRRGGLTLARITATALAMLDDHDLADLTMRSLAERLGTQAGSLYRHIASRDELLVHLLDAALADVPPPPAGPWRVGAAQLSQDARRVWKNRSALAPLLSRYPMLGPNSMRSRELALSHHLAHGYSAQDASEIYTVLTRYVLGSVTARLGRFNELRPSAAQRRAVYASLPPEVYPTVVSTASVSIRLSDDEIFTFMLEAILDRIEQTYRRSAR